MILKWFQLPLLLLASLLLLHSTCAVFLWYYYHYYTAATTVTTTAAFLLPIRLPNGAVELEAFFLTLLWGCVKVPVMRAMPLRQATAKR
jgi:hypothetical protein